MTLVHIINRENTSNELGLGTAKSWKNGSSVFSLLIAKPRG